MDNQIHKEDMIDIVTGAMASVLENHYLEICNDKLAKVIAYCVLHIEHTDEPHLRHILSIISPQTFPEVK